MCACWRIDCRGRVELATSTTLPAPRLASGTLPRSHSLQPAPPPARTGDHRALSHSLSATFCRATTITLAPMLAQLWCPNAGVLVARYVDGYGSCGRTTGSVPTRSSPLFVGAASASLLNPFCGMVHDVRVYNKALTVPELRALWGEMSHKLQVGGCGKQPKLGDEESWVQRPSQPIPLFLFVTITVIFLRCVQFGNVDAPSCVVSEWSSWSTCASVPNPGGAQQSAPRLLKSRARSVKSGGEQGCPDLQEVVECGTWPERPSKNKAMGGSP